MTLWGRLGATPYLINRLDIELRWADLKWVPLNFLRESKKYHIAVLHLHCSGIRAAEVVVEDREAATQ